MVSLLDPRLWLAMAIALAVAYGTGRYQQAGADAARYQARELAAVQGARAEEQRRTQAQAEIAQDATQALDQARADARAAGDVSERLRARIAELLAQRPAPAGGGAPAHTADAMLAELFRRADARAGSLAADLDASRLAGLACERSYDALTVTASHPLSGDEP